jgi:hypothetical protein
MASVSGVVASAEAIELARSFSKHGNKTSVAVFRLHENKTLVVDTQLGETGPMDAEEWDATMAKCLPEDEPRYVIANLAYESITDNVRRSSCIFLMYVPGGSSIKHKMVATMSCKPVHHQLGGLGHLVQACSIGESSYEAVLAHVLSKKSVK